MTVLLILIFLFLGINIRYFLIPGIIGLCVLLFFVIFKLKKKGRTLFVPMFFFMIGVGLSFINISQKKTNYVGIIYEVKQNYFLLSTSLEKIYISSSSHPYEVGDIVDVTGEKKELDFVTLESEFDFKKYLNNKGVYSEIEVSKIKVKFLTPFRFNKIKKDFLNNFDSETASTVGAILFSISGDGETISLSRSLHIVRLISTSGIYLSILYRVVSYLLSFFIKKKKVVDLISVIFLFPHLLFTFPKFVVIKYIVFKTFRWINEYKLDNRFSYLSILSITGIGFLLFDYHLAFQDSFILSYLIPLVAYFIRTSFTGLNRRKKNLLTIFIISLVLIPFVNAYYSEISPISIILQMVFAPIFIAIYLLSLLAFIKVPIYSLIEMINNVTLNLLKIVEKVTFKIYMLPMDSFSILLFLVLLILFIYYSSFSFKPLSRIFGGVFILFNSIYLIPIKPLITSGVSFINVGQGDSTLITYKGTSVLIDTGGLKYKDIAKEVLIPFFKKKQVYRIDLLITTHDDFDHSGGVISLCENFQVNRYVKDYSFFPLTLNNTTFINYNVYPDLWSEENDRSLVIGFSVNKFNYLIMGDAPKKIESAIIKNNKRIHCDILKVGHHGSKTSTSDEFIRYLRPKYGIISCGKNNYYGHPHKEAIAILNKYHVKIRRTDLEGTITF